MAFSIRKPYYKYLMACELRRQKNAFSFPIFRPTTNCSWPNTIIIIKGDLSMENNCYMTKLYETFLNEKRRLDNGEQLEPQFSEGNTKTHIPSVDLLPLLTCHGRCHETCGKIKKGRKVPDCYACKGSNSFSNVIKNRAINTVLAIYCPTILWQAIDVLAKKSRYIRYFVSGDMIIKGFFDNMVATAKNNPYCNFLAFTKCYEIVNRWIAENGDLPKNLIILFSGWENLTIENPYNLPTTTVYKKDSDFNPVWKSCGGNCLNCACYGLGCWQAKKGDIIAFKKH